MNKKALSKDLILTLGFVIVTIMVLVIGVTFVTPLIKHVPEYAALSVEKTIKSAIAAPEEVSIRLKTTEHFGDLCYFNCNVPKDVEIRIKDDKACTTVKGEIGVSQESQKDVCFSFVKDDILDIEDTKDYYVGGITIEKKEGKLIFR